MQQCRATMTCTKKTNTKPCTFCLLCRKNVQLCEATVIFQEAPVRYGALRYKVKTEEEAKMLADREIGLAISSIMIYARAELGLEVGQTAVLDGDSYEWVIGRISADVYMLCFHAKSKVHKH